MDGRPSDAGAQTPAANIAASLVGACAPPPSPRRARRKPKDVPKSPTDGSHTKAARPSREQIQLLLEKYVGSATSSATASLGTSVVTLAAYEATSEEMLPLGHGPMPIAEPAARPPVARQSPSGDSTKARLMSKGGGVLAASLGRRAPGSPAVSAGHGMVARPSKESRMPLTSPLLVSRHEKQQESSHCPSLHPSVSSRSSLSKESLSSKPDREMQVAAAVVPQGIGDSSAALLRAGLAGDVTSNSVATPFGLGSLISARPGDGSCTVQFPWGRAYLSPHCIDSSRVAVLECQLQSLRSTLALLVADLPRPEIMDTPRRRRLTLRQRGTGLAPCPHNLGCDLDACSVSTDVSSGGLPAEAAFAVRGFGLVQSLITWLEQAAAVPDQATQRAVLLDIAVVLSGLVRVRAERARFGGLAQDPQLEVEKYAAGAVRIHLGLLERLEPAEVAVPAARAVASGHKAQAATSSTVTASSLGSACSLWREAFQRLVPRPQPVLGTPVVLSSRVIHTPVLGTVPVLGHRSTSPMVRMPPWRMMRPGAKHEDRARGTEEVQMLTASLSLLPGQLFVGSSVVGGLELQGQSVTLPVAPTGSGSHLGFSGSASVQSLVYRSPSPVHRVSRMYSASSMTVPVGGLAACSSTVSVGAAPRVGPHTISTPVLASHYRTLPSTSFALGAAVRRTSSETTPASVGGSSIAVSVASNVSSSAASALPANGVVRLYSANQASLGRELPQTTVTRQTSMFFATPAFAPAVAPPHFTTVTTAPPRYLSPSLRHRAVTPLPNRATALTAKVLVSPVTAGGPDSAGGIGGIQPLAEPDDAVVVDSSRSATGAAAGGSIVNLPFAALGTPMEDDYTEDDRIWPRTPAGTPTSSRSDCAADFMMSSTRRLPSLASSTPDLATVATSRSSSREPRVFV